MDISDTVTRIFTNNDVSIPLGINMPIKMSMEDRETKNTKITNCYTTGRFASYLVKQIEYGLEHLMFVHYTRDDAW